MQKDHNSIYNLIAYISLIIAWCLSFVLILFLVNIIEVADKNTTNILSIVIVGFSMIYHKLNPSIPIHLYLERKFNVKIPVINFYKIYYKFMILIGVDSNSLEHPDERENNKKK